MITIRNKKTGEVKQVEETQLGDFGLAPAVRPTTTNSLMMPTTSPNTTTPTSTSPKITFDQLYKMSLDPNVKTTTYNKLKALYDLQNEEDKVEKLSADEVKLKEDKEKAEGLKKTVLETVDQLLARDTGAITGVKNPLKSLTGENAYTKNLFKQVKSLLSLENVKFLKGQGAVSDAERELLANSATSLETNLRNEDFYGELLKIKGALTGEPIEPQTKKKSGFVDALTLGPARRFAQDVGAGAGMNREPGTQESFDATLKMAQTLEEKAKSVIDPIQREKLLKVAQQAREVVGGGAGELSGKFSEDINKGYAGRAFETAASVAGAATIPSTIGAVRSASKSLVTKTPKIIEGFKSLAKPTPAKMSVDELLSGVTKTESGKKVRQELIEVAQDAGKKVDGSSVYRQIEKTLKSAKSGLTPSEQKGVDELIKSANKFYNGKKINPLTAKSRWDLASQGFKDSGKTGDTLKSLYHRTTREALRKQLDKVAPGFEKQTAKIAEGINLDKLLKPIKNAEDRKLIKEARKEIPSLLQRFTKKLGGKTGDITAGVVIYSILDFLKGRKKKEE